MAEEPDHPGIRNINEFLYFDGEKIIGYAGICSFGPGAPEVNGMVHPDYRGQGVFTSIHALVMAEWKRRGSGDLLLLCDRNSVLGQRFVKGTGAGLSFSEYEMYLTGTPSAEDPKDIVFRKATNADAAEIARQNKIFHGDVHADPQKEAEADVDPVFPEEEASRGVSIFMAEKAGVTVGKVHLQMADGVGGIYGLGVLPAFRRQGFGRAILLMAAKRLREEGACEIMLQVVLDNANALNLYKSCGFSETSMMDYFVIQR